MPGGLIDLMVVCLLQNSFKTGLSFTDFFLAAIPIKTQIPLFVPENTPSQNCLPEMWLKMTVIYLSFLSLHLGVLYLHLSKLSLFTIVSLKTFWCCSEPQGSPFTHITSRESWDLCAQAARQPLGTCCPLMAQDTAQQHSGMLSIFHSAATCFCSAHTHRRKAVLSTFKHFIFSPDPHQPLPLSSITSIFFLK